MVVGEEGFEPPTLWSQTRCATKLRYSPTNSFLGTLLEGSTLWSAIPNIRDALSNCAIHRHFNTLCAVEVAIILAIFILATPIRYFFCN